MRTLLFLTFSLSLTTACGPAAPTEDQAQDLTGSERQEYIDKGKAIAGATFTTLSGQLGKAMRAGGVQNAVAYCQLAAYPLVDSLSREYNARIRRTSRKVRNPQDAPEGWETEVLTAYHEAAAAGEELSPRVRRLESGEIAFAAPIKIQGLCLKCHGAVGTDISAADYARIKELYPDDQATGYKLGELRGMWSIVFSGSTERETAH